MNHYISGIIKLALLEGSVALLVVDLVAAGRFEKGRARAAAVLAGLMVFAWANYGALRAGTSVGYVLLAPPVVLACGWLVQAGFGEALSERMKAFRARAAGFGGPKVASVALATLLAVGWVGQGLRTGGLELVHPWEQFHFYLGAKYQRELGWFNLYKATILADRETVHALDSLSTTRDLTTFDQVPVSVALQDQAQVRERFSDQSWAEFKADWVTFTRVFPMNWDNMMNDHGNSNSPAWAIVAHPLAALVPISRDGNSWLGWLDMLLMLAMWLCVWQAFGHRVAAMGLLAWAMEPLVFDYLSGSFLRWDWLFATGLAACCLKWGRYRTAGAFFGYAIATKLFPIFFGVALGARALLEYRRTKAFAPKYRDFAIGTVAAGAACVVLAAVLFGPGAWLEYAQRIQVAQVEKFYAIQYSLKTVWLQYAAGTWQVWSQGLFPTEVLQARADVDIKDYAVGFLLVRLVFTALILQLVRRADDVEAYLLGPLLVFTWLTVNMYYWNMLGLLAMGLMLRLHKSKPAAAMLMGLQGIFGFYYLYQHFNRGMTEGLMVATLLSLLIVFTALWEASQVRRTAAAP